MTPCMPRDQHLRILSLLADLDPLLAPGANPDPLTLDARWSVVARWALVQMEIDADRWHAGTGGDLDPGGEERAQAALALITALRVRLTRHDARYADRRVLATETGRFVDATRRLAQALRRHVLAVVADSLEADLPRRRRARGLPMMAEAVV